ncbi:MAG: nucleotide exchange factor GrpE [Kofleriaceae bacterium]|nr:nucleotide exchange factor GrpE [Kofleriaceae bacterium]MCB9572093.1 nucleotide exchange factor GrpE [Kofleriaceae bacterium]
MTRFPFSGLDDDELAWRRPVRRWPVAAAAPSGRDPEPRDPLERVPEPAPPEVVPEAARPGAGAGGPATGDDRAALRAAIADLEAARGRVERDAARVLDETRERLVGDLLPVLDSLDRARADRSASGEATEGIERIRAQLEGVLRGYGLERFDAVGAAFDPRDHEAVALCDVVDPARDGTVVAQWEPGYRMGGRLLRPARVQVGRLARRDAGDARPR